MTCLRNCTESQTPLDASTGADGVAARLLKVVPGDVVLYSHRCDEPTVNGVSIHPAIVTRAFANNELNLLVFFDDAFPESRRSVKYHADAPAFEAYWVERQ